MSIIKEKTIFLQANDGSELNELIFPDGGDVFIQLDRGFQSVLSSYRVDLYRKNDAGDWQQERSLGQGIHPASAGANTPFFNVGSPAQLADTCVTTIADMVAVPPDVDADIAMVVDLYQKKPDNSYRRVTTESIRVMDTSETGKIDVYIKEMV